MNEMDQPQVQTAVDAVTQPCEGLWFVLERHALNAHPEVPRAALSKSVILVAKLPVLIQVYPKGSGGELCFCYFEVLPEFHKDLFGRSLDGKVYVCPHMGHFATLEEVVR